MNQRLGTWGSTVLRGWTGCIVAVLCLLLSGCGGSAAAPDIESFTASVAAARPGETLTLTAVFSGGTARIDQGVGEVRSGARVTVTMPEVGRRFTLTVTNADGVEVQASVTVDLILARAWDFEGTAPGWQLSAEEGSSAEVRDGQLQVAASQYSLDGRCTAASARAPLDSLLAAMPDWTELRVRVDLSYAFGTGMGYPRIELSWDGYQLGFNPGDVSGVRVEVVFDRATGQAKRYQDGVLLETTTPLRTLEGSMVGLLADACAADLESESIGASALSVELR